jgi:hypothetical protein
MDWEFSIEISPGTQDVNAQQVLLFEDPLNIKYAIGASDVIIHLHKIQPEIDMMIRSAVAGL